MSARVARRKDQGCQHNTSPSNTRTYEGTNHQTVVSTQTEDLTVALYGVWCSPPGSIGLVIGTNGHTHYSALSVIRASRERGDQARRAACQANPRRDSNNRQPVSPERTLVSGPCAVANATTRRTRDATMSKGRVAVAHQDWYPQVRHRVTRLPHARPPSNTGLTRKG